ncbi:hypothetical protein CSB37_00725 [bacterium DOLZORAL124_38_8]|nr:MAG: hypothetical protein CSB37_00725 [bacterium DOLZORAL124_38_8]
MITLSSLDYSALVYGRKILKHIPTAHISFDLQNKSLLSESLWKQAVEDIFQHTNFGRIAFVYDRKNKSAQTWIEKLKVENLEYTPKHTSRCESLPKITYLETQVLAEMANEGLADSIEFRRLCRRQLRPLKHAHIDTVLFFDDILGEEKTRKIIQTILVSQIKAVFPVDFFDISDIQGHEKREISIKTNPSEQNFTKKRAQKILQTQLSDTVFK